MTIRRNLIRDPAAVLRTDWAATASAGSPTISTLTGTGPIAGVNTAARVTASTVCASLGATLGASGAQLVTPGKSYTLSGYLRPNTSSAAQAVLKVLWVNSGGTLISTLTSTTAAAGQDVYTRFSVTGVAPATAVRATLSLAVTGSFAFGDRIDVACVMLESATSALSWFNGSSGPWFSWDGAPNASTSAWFSPTITVNPTVDDDPCPRAEVLITDIPAAAQTVTVYRLAANREYEVRGAIQARVVGALTRIDFEIPFGVTVTYRAQLFDVAGIPIGYTDPASVVVDCDDTWVHNPLDPQGAAKVMFDDTAARSLQRPTEGDYAWPIGRTVGVVVSGQRRGIQDAVLDVKVDTLDQADRLQAMFGAYGERKTPVICFRIGSNDRVRLPRPLFAGVLNLDEKDMTYVLGGETIAFGMTGSEVSPPTPALVVPLLTRADINAAFPSRAALNAFFLTRLDVNRAYNLAGTSP